MNFLKFKNVKLHNLLVHYLSIKEWQRVIPLLRGRCIDIGCGEKPLERLVAPHVSRYIGMDYKETLHDKTNIDLFGSAYHIPVKSYAFDSVICSAVLEHLEEPEIALRESCRILKPGGIAIYTVPFIWHLHEEPRDFYRFSKYGLKYLYSKVGFEIMELKSLSGFWATFGQLSVYNIYRFNHGLLRWLRIIDVCGLVMQLAFYCLDKIDKTEEWTWMYMVVVKKK